MRCALGSLALLGAWCHCKVRAYVWYPLISGMDDCCTRGGFAVPCFLGIAQVYSVPRSVGSFSGGPSWCDIGLYVMLLPCLNGVFTAALRVDSSRCRSMCCWCIGVSSTDCCWVVLARVSTVFHVLILITTLLRHTSLLYQPIHHALHARENLLSVPLPHTSPCIQDANVERA